MIKPEVAIIGGSGLYAFDTMRSVERLDVSTPFGSPSDAIVVGDLGGISVAFLARHGSGHSIGPAEVPSRANIYALKSLGVRRILAVSAVGSLQERIRPLDFVIPDQIIDRTAGRQSTFFEQGVVAHVGFADPFCPQLSEILVNGSKDFGLAIHEGGTYIAIEGPSFSTRAESRLYRSWDGAIVGMTALPEAKLAREAEICYAMLACVTDYDVWRQGTIDVSVETIVANLEKNVKAAKLVVSRIVPLLEPNTSCVCQRALSDAIATNVDGLSEDLREKLKVIVGDRFA